MPNVGTMYYEDYCDQMNGEFDYMGYTNLSGEQIVVPIIDDIVCMANEIKRKNGADTLIRVYRPRDV